MVVVLAHVAVVVDELRRAQGLLVEVHHRLLGAPGGLAGTHLVPGDVHGLQDDVVELLLPVGVLAADGEGAGDQNPVGRGIFYGGVISCAGYVGPDSGKYLFYPSGYYVYR